MKKLSLEWKLGIIYIVFAIIMIGSYFLMLLYEV